jgi:hypothetical protein
MLTSFFAVNFRRASRSPLALFNASNLSISAHKCFLLSPNTLTRSFIASSRVPFALEQVKSEPEEDSPKTEKTTTSKANKASKPEKKQKRGVTKEPKLEPKVVITDDMKPPRIPAGSFFRFSREWFSNRPKSKSILEQAELAKECGVAWQSLSEDEKQPYRETARIEREAYSKERRQWLENVDPLVLKGLNKLQAAKGKPRIKPLKKQNDNGRPLNPFLQFTIDFRSEQGQVVPPTEIFRRAGEAWRALSDTERQPYRDRFDNERDAWRERQKVTVAAT